MTPAEFDAQVGLWLKRKRGPFLEGELDDLRQGWVDEIVVAERIKRELKRTNSQSQRHGPGLLRPLQGQEGDEGPRGHHAEEREEGPEGHLPRVSAARASSG